MLSYLKTIVLINEVILAESFGGLVLSLKMVH